MRAKPPGSLLIPHSPAQRPWLPGVGERESSQGNPTTALFSPARLGKTSASQAAPAGGRREQFQQINQAEQNRITRALKSLLKPTKK